MPYYTFKFPDRLDPKFKKMCINCFKTFPADLTITCPKCKSYLCETCAKQSQKCKYCKEWDTLKAEFIKYLILFPVFIGAFVISLIVSFTLTSEWKASQQVGLILPIMFGFIALIVLTLVKILITKGKGGSFSHPNTDFKQTIR